MSVNLVKPVTLDKRRPDTAGEFYAVRDDGSVHRCNGLKAALQENSLETLHAFWLYASRMNAHYFYA